MAAKDDTTSVDTRNCPWCAEEILAEAKKCKHCGEFLTDDVPTPSAKTAVAQDTEDVETSEPDVSSTALTPRGRAGRRRGRERRGVKAAVIIMSTAVVTALVLFGVGTLTNVKLGNDATPACQSALAGDKQAIQWQTAGIKDEAQMAAIYKTWDYALVGMSIPDQQSVATLRAAYTALRAQSIRLEPVLSRNRLACLDGS